MTHPVWEVRTPGVAQRAGIDEKQGFGGEAWMPRTRS